MYQLIKYSIKFMVVIATLLILSCGQSKNKQETKATSNNMKDIERLLDITFPLVKDELKKQGEFLPLACAVKSNDSIAQIANYDGGDSLLSNTLIDNLKLSIRSKKEDYKSAAIFYDVRVPDPNTKLKTDAIAVFAENKPDTIAYLFYDPYNLTTDGQLKFSLSWKKITEKEIFIN